MHHLFPAKLRLVTATPVHRPANPARPEWKTARSIHALSRTRQRATETIANRAYRPMPRPRPTGRMELGPEPADLSGWGRPAGQMRSVPRSHRWLKNSPGQSTTRRISETAVANCTSPRQTDEAWSWRGLV